MGPGAEVSRVGLRGATGAGAEVGAPVAMASDGATDARVAGGRSTLMALASCAEYLAAIKPPDVPAAHTTTSN